MCPRVLVVGGGPAGSACAITTARAGLETIVFEKGEINRDKVCGDVLLPNSQRLLSSLEVSDSIKGEGLETSKIVVYFPKFKPIELEMSVITLQRKTLDQLLRNKVEYFGGEVKHNSEIKDVRILDDKVFVTDVFGNNYYGDIVVLSTGSRTNLAQKLGFTFDENKVGAALRGYMKNGSILDHGVVYFNEDMSGYGWIFPCPENILNVGFGIYNSPDSLQYLFKRFLKEKVSAFCPNLEFTKKPRGAPLRIGLRKKDICSDRVLLIGENIDCVYDLTGDGIGPAIESGIVAGEVLVKSEIPYDLGQLKEYETMIWSRIGKTHRNFTLIKRLLSNPTFNYIFTNTLALSDAIRMSFSKYLNRI